MNDAHQLLTSVLEVAGHVEARLESALTPSGLSLAKLGALRHLAEAHDPLSLGQLAERIACVKSNVTQLVDRLEADALVQRFPDPADRRSVRAVITDQGRERYEAGMRAVKVAEAALVAELAPADQKTLHLLLSRLSRGSEQVSH